MVVSIRHAIYLVHFDCRFLDAFGSLFRRQLSKLSNAVSSNTPLSFVEAQEGVKPSKETPL